MGDIKSQGLLTAFVVYFFESSTIKVDFHKAFQGRIMKRSEAKFAHHPD